jgi:hypothetical protein
MSNLILYATEHGMLSGMIFNSFKVNFEKFFGCLAK